MTYDTAGASTGLVHVGGVALEYQRIHGDGRSDGPTLVFLHEGLGSVSQWRAFPQALCGHVGLPGLVYSRLGHGRSQIFLDARPPRFMHDEAVVTVPGILEVFGLGDYILVGHSDGASIALIHAASAQPGPRALVLEAPHVFVEDVTIDSIRHLVARYESTDLPHRMARHHGDNTESLFRSWTQVWLSEEFRRWSIEALLPSVVAPSLVLQGRDDEYGTAAQVERVARGVGGSCQTTFFDACRHAPHFDQPSRVLDAIAAFLRCQLAPR